MALRDEARFYSINGHQYPSVTTVLQVVNKPALIQWSANQERAHFSTAMLEVLARPGITRTQVLDAVIHAVSGVKAAEKAKREAATIGTAVHAGIAWWLRAQKGDDPGPEPVLPDPAAWAVEAFKDWAAAVKLVPLAIERTVYDAREAYAGTLDCLALVNGIPTVLDWKSGKAIYPEMLLQAVAYRHAAACQGLVAEQAIIVRVPKIVGDPAPETMLVPDSVTISDFLAALRLWRCVRQLEGRPTGRRIAS